jgi:ATP-dependent HslUV protease subunit HslV
VSTVVVVKKNGTVAIAADTLTTYGSRKVSLTHTKQSGKILRVGESYIGMTGWAVSQQVAEHAFRSAGEPPALANTTQIFDVFLALHARMKQEYFLTPRVSDSAAFESSHLYALIANAHGIFGVYALRDVFEYERFWASGSGGDYALGAMHALYDTAADAVTIAEAGVRAGIEFDDATGAPIESYVIQLAVPPAVDVLELLLKV